MLAFNSLSASLRDGGFNSREMHLSAMLMPLRASSHSFRSDGTPNENGRVVAISRIPESPEDESRERRDDSRERSDGAALWRSSMIKAIGRLWELEFRIAVAMSTLKLALMLLPDSITPHNSRAI